MDYSVHKLPYYKIYFFSILNLYYTQPNFCVILKALEGAAERIYEDLHNYQLKF